MALTLRLQKGSKLTFGEADENFKYLETLGFQGALKKTDEPELAGFYLPQENGTYPNAGGLSVDYAGADAGKVVLFTFDRTEWKKIEVSIGAGGGGSSYVLPTASASVLGGVKVGANLAIDVLTGVMSATDTTYTFKTINGQVITGSGGITGLATESWVQGLGYITSSSLSGLASESWVEGKGYITSSSLSGLATESWVQGLGYATESWVNNKGYITNSDLTGLATETWVSSQGYITASSLSGYATETWVSNQGYITSSALAGLATESWVENKGYITSSAITGKEDIANKATSFSTINDTLYPTTKAVNDELSARKIVDNKNVVSGFTPTLLTNHIVTCTQVEFTNFIEGNEDPNTTYLIVEPI